MLTSVKYWLWLTCLLDPAAAWRVFCHFGSPEKAYFADPGEYSLIEGLSSQQQKLLEGKSVTFAEQILARCDSKSIRILTYSDTDFPERLRNIAVPPLVLYLRGRMLRFDERAVIAMAGTRRATLYGTQAAYTFAKALTQGGGLVATGIVSGCDASALKGALSAGGPLVCVVAGGVDVPYADTPAGCSQLEEVASRGAILSEAPPGTGHKGALFHRRNAILTGLSVGLLCIEAGLRSGTLGVAELANEQGKDVFAIPANLGAKSSLGTNDLLRQGLARPVLTAEDILSCYSYLLPQQQAAQTDCTRWKLVRCPAASEKPAAGEDAPGILSAASGPAGTEGTENLPAGELSDISPEKKVDTGRDSGYIELLDASGRWSEQERILLKALISGPATVEALIATTGSSAGLVAATLTMLAVTGAVRELPGGRFQLVPEALG
ncbi:MAG: DNA-processing protein DprA [Candidatus Onthomonas sp.]